MTSSLKKYILLFFQGALIGTGAILPGISGGVLCVSFGIYEPMMSFLSHPFSTFRTHFRVLLPVIIGGGAGFVILAKIVESFLQASAVAALSLFCGLICGTVPDLMKKSVSSDSSKGWAGFIIALMVSFVLFHILDSGIEGHVTPDFGWYIFCGAVWGLSMVVPGLSSSSILLFIGLYQPMAEGIGNMDLSVLVPMAIGFTATVAVTARIINYLLKEYYAVLSKVILGFVISSVLMIVPVSYGSISQLLLAIGCFSAGFAAAVLMDLKRPR